MEIYEVVAKCKTPNCESILSLGTTAASSSEALAHQLSAYSSGQSTCPDCQNTALYSSQDYRAILLNSPEPRPTDE